MLFGGYTLTNVGNIPFSRTLFSFVCTGWYARLLDTFPVIDMTGPVFVIGCGRNLCPSLKSLDSIGGIKPL